MREICSKLEQISHIVLEQISHIVLVFPLFSGLMHEFHASH